MDVVGEVFGLWGKVLAIGAEWDWGRVDVFEVVTFGGWFGFTDSAGEVADFGGEVEGEWREPGWDFEVTGEEVMDDVGDAVGVWGGGR